MEKKRNILSQAETDFYIAFVEHWRQNWIMVQLVLFLLFEGGVIIHGAFVVA